MRTHLKTALAFLRNTWRGLTSMRTALVLLFLLAMASLPGALIPQRSQNQTEVDRYFDEYPTLAPVLDDLGVFEVFSSVWFASIYVLLFISLIGCLVPRCAEHYRQWRAKPVRTPRNLSRMPHHAETTVDGSVDDALGAARSRLRGWRTAEEEEPDGARSISAERGYLREAGNLIFHFALVGLLIAFAGGKLYNYEGQVIVMADGSEFCNAGTYNYDSFIAGLNVDGTGLNEFCVRVNDFDVQYQHTGQVQSYVVDTEYQSTEDLQTGQWQPHRLEVNHPLRTSGDRVYLTGNGYAPQFTVTFPDGQQRTQLTQWQPVDVPTMLSQGATKFDRPGVEDERERRQNQIAVSGLFAPTPAFDGAVLSSQFPDLNDPTVAVDVLRGDLGLDSGRGQSIFSVDQQMVEQGRLNREARENLRVGEEVRLADGTTVRFDGVERFANLQVSHDPTQMWVLGFAILIIAGIGASLTIKRRRVWVRARPADPADPDAGRTIVEIGGLARTDQAGYGEEFYTLTEDILGTDADRTSETRADLGAARGRND
ncbi:cytochrome c biogenesis protein ResB [Saccharopolyspora sp. HNM0983]|uniref:Cytochrome c biogenesis protein ResB n=1 Tax=Saccharopolyspora montiporae TaxID=2781240 RepID=A0A929BCA4_9PSEU|nr:cytochrome c biogenesis protein ResB [Saccharopolyspora sp. HNM0983]MBE9374892.1 cytochrome c biogenesis protein ResB [Saccharopolyspora sp. HNM0983]